MTPFLRVPLLVLASPLILAAAIVLVVIVLTFQLAECVVAALEGRPIEAIWRSHEA
jgi:hypothetical protein